jgi:hypothetical protein
VITLEIIFFSLSESKNGCSNSELVLFPKERDTAIIIVSKGAASDRQVAHKLIFLHGNYIALNFSQDQSDK